MAEFPIGVMLDSFKKPIPEAMETAEKMGVQGIQLYAWHDYDPDRVTPAKTRELLSMAQAHGLVFSAVCGDFGIPFDHAERNKELIERSKRVLEFAKNLNTDIVTTHVGTIPNNKQDDRYRIIQEACFHLCEFADSLDAHFAIETGTERAETLKTFLDDLHSKGVAVNFDPANLTMQDPYGTVQDVYTLRDYIVHTHAKDAVNLRIHSKETQAWYLAHAKVEDDIYSEVPLGKGDVPFPAYIQALNDIGYRGFLTVEREVGSDPTADIREAVTYLQTILAQ